jgi:hypothetical protein
MVEVKVKTVIIVGELYDVTCVNVEVARYELI